MIIKCAKCQKQLTKDLFYTPAKYDKCGFLKNLFFDAATEYSSGAGAGDPDVTPEWKFKAGCFSVIYDFRSGATQPSKNQQLIVSEESILRGIIPKFIQGYGCCNWSLGEPLNCSCGNSLGKMHLDCYEDGVVKFRKNGIRRVYK